ncbi:MAG: response regulator [Verrucomicrobiales bacterium]
MSLKILIVDDSGLARRMTRQVLEQLGHVVDEASDGAQALERFVLNPPEMVILDMVMSGMYGLEVLEKMQQLNPKLPVIIATADIQQSTKDQVKTAGAAGLINKPLKKDELSEMIEAVRTGGSAWN